MYAPAGRSASSQVLSSETISLRACLAYLLAGPTPRSHLSDDLRGQILQIRSDADGSLSCGFSFAFSGDKHAKGGYDGKRATGYTPYRLAGAFACSLGSVPKHRLSEGDRDIVMGKADAGRDPAGNGTSSLPDVIPAE